MMKVSLNERERFVLEVARAVNRYWVPNETHYEHIISGMNAALLISNKPEIVEEAVTPGERLDALENKVIADFDANDIEWLIRVARAAALFASKGATRWHCGDEVSELGAQGLNDLIAAVESE